MRLAVVAVSVGFHALVIATAAGVSTGTAVPSGVGLAAPHEVDVELLVVSEAVAPPPSTTSTTAPSPPTHLPMAARVPVPTHSAIATTSMTVGSERVTERAPVAEGGREGGTSDGARLRMRRAGGPTLELSAETPLATPRDPAPVATPDDRWLPRGGGTYVIKDRVTKMTIAADGTATFQDKRDFTIRVIVPLSLSRDDWEAVRDRAKAKFQAWVADPYAAQRPVNYEEVPEACAVGACDTTGDSDEGGGLISGKADITAALHRRFIGDPFASRKLALLDSTRDARAEIGANYRTHQLDRSAEIARRNVDALWQATEDAAERRAALFAMWDECEEGDGERGEAGQRARSIVLGAIRTRLPAGSPDAFTDREIAALDATRASRQHFAPY